jgi:hypothetical protein
MTTAEKPATVEKEKAPAAPVRAPAVAPNRMLDAASMQQRWFVEVNAGVTVADLLHPPFWSHCANKLKNLAVISVMPADESYYCELLVRDVGRLYAVVSVLNFVQLATDLSVPVDAAYEIKWRGPVAKYGVLRLADKEIVRDGFVDKAEAQTWLTEHLKAFTR